MVRDSLPHRPNNDIEAYFQKQPRILGVQGIFSRKNPPLWGEGEK
ncbi:hypothetical protein N44_01544 [Microcystis aeruginosa NIES-44]|uniref:Uncharacterized protein n=1 Tax=Microcystis aeruginosa NIES-44 TaxID=449439 RepID=A0A0A1VQI8_MICAE|nr:hypothetical protein N44_01544 [Microcystis aeruginosa NIES-44]